MGDAVVGAAEIEGLVRGGEEDGGGAGVVEGEMAWVRRPRMAVEEGEVGSGSSI